MLKEMLFKALPYLPRVLFILLLLFLLVYLSHYIDRQFKKIHNKLGRGLGLEISKAALKSIIYSILIVLIIANIPGINEGVLKTLGYIITGIVAFSSSTLIANGMSGIMVKIMKPFSIGNVVKIGSFLGEVAEMSTFHVLIETPMKEIVTIPYVNVIKEPVINYSKDTPVIHVELSLGYDIDRIHVELLLNKAAESTGLKSHFVSVINLGDHSIVYRLSGAIHKVKQMIFIESNLRKAILDQFHLAKIEIMSPIYINQRKADELVVPTVTKDTKKLLLRKEQVEKEEALEIEKKIFKVAEEVIRKQKAKMDK